MRFDRRQLLAGSAVSALARPIQGEHRNVLLLIADDHSPIAGCYGNAVVATPNMDRLAKNGLRFTNAFCTTASCSASRSVILTGLQNHSNGQFGHAHAPHNFHTHNWVQPIPRLTRNHNCASGVIGKLHVIPPSVYTWDLEVAGNSGNRDVYDLAQRSRNFFRSIGGKPFYLHVGFGDPHRAGSGFANDRDYPKVQKRTYSPADVVVPPFLSDTPELRRELAGYYEAIDRLDQGIGFVLEALENSGRAKDTLIIYMSDHGMPFPGAKASFYDSGLRCPLIVQAPGMERRGVTCDALVHWPDIAPTVLDWMGLPGPSYPLPGKSLLPLFNRPETPFRDEFFFSHSFHELNNYYPFRGIRTRQYKYIKFLYPELEMPLPSDLFASTTWQSVLRRKDDEMGRRRTSSVLHHEKEELYDLENDPDETRNIAAAQPGKLWELREKVKAFRRETTDPWWIVDRQRGEA